MSLNSLFNTVMTAHIEDKLEMNRKHLDAYRRAGLGMAQASEGEDMRITSAGDVHYYHPPAPTPQPAPQKSSILPMLLTAGLTAAGFAPVAGVAGYLANHFLSQKQSEGQGVAIPPKIINNTNTELLDIRILDEDDLQP